VSTLWRYLSREIIAATAFVLLALLAIFGFYDVVAQLDDIGTGGYTLGAALGYVALSQPTRVYELMPIAALIGTVYALAKLASNSEFTIMRVSGMSTRRLAGWVIGAGLVFVLATYALGELIAPEAERMAQRLKLQSSGVLVAREFRSGVWVRDLGRDDTGQIDRLRFIHVGRVQLDATVQNWRIFEFDRDFRLRSISTAERGVFDPDDGVRIWQLSNVVETRIPVPDAADPDPTPLHTEVVRESERRWASELSPEIFGVLLVRPERMGLVALAQYIDHLAENRQQTHRYEIALWGKLLYPLAILVMMMLALPFAYLHVRQGSVSLKIFAGVMIGVGFYVLNRLFAHVGALHTWPPLLVAALPSLIVLALALAALHWIERR
jgi:lipopolysaccharide export system permease protein